MKPYLYFIFIGLAAAGCGGQAERRVAYVERPGQTELNETKHVKVRSGRENKKRVEYYNSLQYKGAYKQF